MSMKTDPSSPVHGTEKELRSLLHEIDGFHGDSQGLKRLQGMVNKIDSSRVNGVFGWQDGQDPPEGQAVLHALLHECYRKVKGKLDLLDMVEQEELDPALLPIKHDIEGVIKSLKAVENPTEELPRIQGRLDAIDSKRVNGIFGDPKNILPGQAVLHDLLNEAYSTVHQLQARN
ncbi:unnamed protein product [Vitrella brassicaformis CCMP3155]|uniref:Uncharacterized protein n=1 Tax=Vitrella brassicaformis (strain CCMP3155) TaxID=1169540 RepID=A0A0G4EXV1_VITBC|nr:unnamed protein product [Vitrella brassicaformis CCMP3155]|eukprot:CEM03546.1 unnamed protein product [Vitrella brassicaformis CCMP3155]